MNSPTPIQQHPQAMVDSDDATLINAPICVYVVFPEPAQAYLLERLMKRLTKGDLLALLFESSEADILLTALGNVRAPLKIIHKSIMQQHRVPTGEPN